ncbi:SDR family NAD(P)-dependent oxidoreductase [Saccharopolyspora sp. NPDC000359]|uniref:SDR family NAD(P)-dependent oxidoreductase n=1 Tax=Saccharopolyspora sp. NPDC000359 TaxID=3154251 RepID=UPI0033186D83
MNRKHAVVTGATAGLGRALAQRLAERGYDVTLVGRDERRTAQVADELTREVGEAGPRISWHLADLARQAEVRKLASALADDGLGIDVLINNAGAAFGSFASTPDGAERTYALNHHAPLLLTHELLAGGSLSADARIVNMSSFMEKRARLAGADPDVVGTSWADQRYSQTRVYATSKLLALLAAVEAARRAPGAIRVYNADPGMVRTGFTSNAGGPMRLTAPLFRLWSVSIEQGIQTPLWLATADEPPEPNGGFFARSRPATPSARALDPELAREVYQRTTAFLGIAPL